MKKPYKNLGIYNNDIVDNSQILTIYSIINYFALIRSLLLEF